MAAERPDPADKEAHPIGQEYIVPLCKTGSGSFMILDLDPDKDCEEEVANPSSIQFYDFPVDVPTDTGNDCPKKIEDAVAAENLQGTVQMIPICDGDCVTRGGSDGTYHIIRMVAFYVDYISYANAGSNSACELSDVTDIRHPHGADHGRQLLSRAASRAGSSGT